MMKLQTILATKGTKVFTIRPEQQVKEAINMLVEHNIGALVVVDEDSRPIGIISERDVIHVAAHNDKVLAQMIGEVMTKKLITCTAHDDIHAVAQTMTDRRIRHLPIVEDGKLVGILSIGDVVKAQLQEYQGTIHNLQTQAQADPDK
ncbi:MAG: CBS domain-containing protein [Herpetosiphonaceae bacterium]|nr:CBS domain-containing protein [Herpetosiphonaceae bacterium]